MSEWHEIVSRTWSVLIILYVKGPSPPFSRAKVMLTIWLPSIGYSGEGVHCHILLTGQTSLSFHQWSENKESLPNLFAWEENPPGRHSTPLLDQRSFKNTLHWDDSSHLTLYTLFRGHGFDNKGCVKLRGGRMSSQRNQTDAFSDLISWYNGRTIISQICLKSGLHLSEEMIHYCLIYFYSTLSMLHHMTKYFFHRHNYTGNKYQSLP